MFAILSKLYHTKNYQGTTTGICRSAYPPGIIPYQELPGNYNKSLGFQTPLGIIPYQELPGNYNGRGGDGDMLLGLYHTKNYQGTTTGKTAGLSVSRLYHTKNYQGTTTRLSSGVLSNVNYTIPRTTRELQHRC